MTMHRTLSTLTLLVSVALTSACDPGGGDDAGLGPGTDAGPSGTDAGPGMDAGVDAGPDTDAGTTDAGVLDAGDMDAGDAGCTPDAGEAGFEDGGAPPCVGPAPALPACPGVTPALDFTLTMTSTTPSGGVSTNVRGRHYLDGTGMLMEQRTRETMISPATDLLRIWRAASPGMQVIYAIGPPTPHPFTLEPKARRDAVAIAGELNSLATFPSYAIEMLACLDADDAVACLEARGRFSDMGTSEMVGSDACRVMRWGDESLTLCVPADCDARRTLYPYWVRGPSGISVDFDSPSPATHADDVVIEPFACTFPVPMLELCDHPDL